jgi:ABC-type Fe3+ transport system substrate-binding protein
VVFGGWRREATRRYTQYNQFFLLTIAREFGVEGVARLMANEPTLMHSAQMPRLAGSGTSPGGIYVLPWSLAEMCPRRAHTEVIWPEDGAMAYPLWLTVKNAERTRLEFLTQHFYGAELARYLNHNRYPALCPDVLPSLPVGARLKWLGWNFLRHRGTAHLLKRVRAICAEALEASSCG